MNFLTVLILTASLSTCEVSKSRSHHLSRHGTQTTKPQSSLVEGEWVSHYKEAEAAHGNYTIPADQSIKAEGTKFRVPKEVIDHYGDLVKTPPPQ